MAWNTVDGQHVINIATSHIVTTNAGTHRDSIVYAATARGAAPASYPLYADGRANAASVPSLDRRGIATLLFPAVVLGIVGVRPSRRGSG